MPLTASEITGNSVPQKTAKHNTTKTILLNKNPLSRDVNDSIFLGERSVCSNCSSRDKIEKIELGNKGKLYSYCIVHRSFPGIDVPYISAIVDLDDGGTLKGNLIDCEPDPEKIKFDMPVEIVFDDALGRKDAEGNSYLSYFFKPI